VIMVAWARARIVRRSRAGVSQCMVWSRLEDGTPLCTTNGRPRFDTTPGSRVLRWRNAAPAELLRRHQQALAEAGSPATPSRDAEEAKAHLLEARRRNFEWHLSRGVYVPLSPEERARLGLPAGETLDDGW